jgi:hypothetical protein
MQKREELVDAVIARLARGDGNGAMGNLGVQRAQAIRDARVGNGVIDNHFNRKGRGNSVRGLVDHVLKRLLDEQLELGRKTTTTYQERAEMIADGAGREIIMRALLDDLALYGAVADADEVSRARERAYYLAVALCDATVSRTGEALSKTDRVRPDTRFRKYLVDVHSANREERQEIYSQLLHAAGRKPVHDIARVDLVMRTFLDGAVLTRRIDHGHGKLTRAARDPRAPIALDDEKLLDAVLRIFVAMSQPTSGIDSGPGAVLFGEAAAAKSPIRSETVLYRKRNDLYGTILAGVESLGEGSVISHCALHTSGGRKSRTREGQRFKRAVWDLLDRGGSLRTLEKVTTLAELKTILARLKADGEANSDLTFRVLVMDSPPGLSPLILHGHAGFLGREVDGVIVDGVAFVEEPGRNWCEAHFQTLWDDERGYTLATPNGLNEIGIDNARRRLEELERQRNRGLA